MRLFVAVEVAGEVKTQLATLIEAGRRSGAEVKWVDPVQVHVTLKFLGEVSESHLEAVKEAVRSSARTHRPVTCEAAGTGIFPSQGPPRVVWIGVARGSDELARLAASVDRALHPLGFPLESRSFSPHLTVDGVMLMQSRLLPKGAVYTALERFPLGDSMDSS